ncbi:hypothetical protein VNO77_17900 [Canavalia gladiata]|uniref:Uncharacterized protein n=1 Tax=Canavalia gladiata TaxID=3824 RepID=A0AAN9LJW4_CANGL
MLLVWLNCSIDCIGLIVDLFSPFYGWIICVGVAWSGDLSGVEGFCSDNCFPRTPVMILLLDIGASQPTTKSLGLCITELLSQLLTIVTEFHIYQPSQITPVAETVVESVYELAQIMKETRYVVERIVGLSGELTQGCDIKLWNRLHAPCHVSVNTIGSVMGSLASNSSLLQLKGNGSIKSSVYSCNLTLSSDFSGVDAFCSELTWPVLYPLSETERPSNLGQPFDSELDPIPDAW